MPLVIATSNSGKLDEFRGLLPAEIQLCSAAELGIMLPPETGDTYAENALLKADCVAQRGFTALADDSGLEIDALDRSPGVRSSRYAGDDATDAMNNDKALRALMDVPAERRTARFQSVIVLMTPDRRMFRGRGNIEGRIVSTPRGAYGFGYDPLFEIDDPETVQENGFTIAELPPDRKNLLSHRARALRDLLKCLSEKGLHIVDLTGDRSRG